jgi:hypothetical protein
MTSRTPSASRGPRYAGRRAAARSLSLLAAFALSAVALVGIPSTKAGFTTRGTDTANTASSGTVLLSDTIGGTACTSSGTSITSDSANCPTNPVASGLLPAVGASATSTFSLSAPGTLLGSVRTHGTVCGAQSLADAAGANTALDHNTVAFGQAGPLGGLALGLTQSSSAYLSTLTSVANPQNFSVTAWFYYATGASGTILALNSSPDSTAGTADRALWLQNNRVYWGIDNGALTSIRSGTLTANTWHQAAASIGASGMRLYIDGALIATNATVTTARNFTGYWHVGWGAQSGWTNGPANSFWNGRLANVAVIPGQISAAQATTLWTRTTAAAEQAAIAALAPTYFWHLDDDGTGRYGGSLPGLTNNFSDIAGSSDNGTGTAGVTSGSAGPLDSVSALFDGSTGVINTPNLNTNQASLTLATWFKGSGSGFLMQWNNSLAGTPTTWDRQIWVDPGGHVVFGVWNGPEVTLTSPGVYNDNAWHLVVASIGAAGMRLTIDGTLVGSNTTTTPEVSNGYWHIGWGHTAIWADMPASGFWNGSIGHAAVFDRQLSSAQSATLWSQPTAAAYDDAVLALTPQYYWPLSDQPAGACSLVNMTIQVTTAGVSACVLPVVPGSACPAPGPAVTLASWLAVSAVMPGMAAGGTQTVTIKTARGTIASAAAGLHIGGSAWLQGSSSGFSATLVHSFGMIDL